MAVDYRAVGNRIKNARKRKGITQEELAKKMNFSVAYLSRVERGSSEINLKRITQLSEKLEIPIEYLLSGTSEKSSNYLSKEFSDILKLCTPQKQRMIFEIAKIVSET